MILLARDVAKKIETDKIAWGTVDVSIPSHQENDRLEEARKINTYYEAGRLDEILPPGAPKTELVAEARRIIRLENGPQSYEYQVYALRLGDFALACFPGEPFTEIHNRALAQSPFENTMVCALTNNCCGYFPTSQAYREGGYEAKTSVYNTGADDRLVEGMTKLLNSLI